jgi:two-component system response regulator ResD
MCTADIRRSVTDVLTGEGYQVLEAGDGEEALEILSTMTTHPCLVRLDLMMMPRMTGTEFLAVVVHDLVKLPVFVVSAFAVSFTLAPGAR